MPLRFREEAAAAVAASSHCGVDTAVQPARTEDCITGYNHSGDGTLFGPEPLPYPQHGSLASAGPPGHPPLFPDAGTFPSRSSVTAGMRCMQTCAISDSFVHIGVHVHDSGSFGVALKRVHNIASPVV